MRTIALLLALVLVSGALISVPAAAAPDRREMQAREAYAAGNYQPALDLYVKLYAEKLNPIFLRNIGRCYQNLGDADKAINSFREYLRKAKDLKADERAEVNGYIAEMDALKKKNEREPSPPPSEKRLPETPPIPAVVEPSHSPPSAPPPPAQQTMNLSVTTTPAPPISDEAGPVYTRWWFWAIVGGVVVAGVGGAAAAGLFTRTTDAPCMAPRTCP